MMWRIVEWSKQQGRGRIESAETKTGRAADMEFVAEAAQVDDFEPGELVHIEVKSVHGQHRVERIWTDEPRFCGHLIPSTPVPDLKPAIAQRIEQSLSKLTLRERYRLAPASDGSLALQGEDGWINAPQGDEILATHVSYREVATCFEAKYIRLAKEVERRYLATRVEDFGAEDVALTMIDEEDRFYFIVASDIEYRDPRPS